ncbi:uncharacterized protein [Fopius arisanus]|uniref:Uncharacterized protein n=1 Tax=Fopius arisanus TaxID=64838 RepID=A0A9R1TA84_9HYME|nr:PREDICTED: uncharacterized protein LOC105267953 [Fopius arisanus]
MWLTAVFNTTYNVLFFEMMMRVVTQVKILKNRFRVMMATLLKRNRTKKRFIDGNLLMEHELFRNCVQYHIAIRRMARDINSVFSTIILIQYLITSLILCSTVYLMSEITVFSGDFLNLGLYFLAIFLQITMLCCAGHRTCLEVIRSDN